MDTTREQTAQTEEQNENLKKQLEKQKEIIDKITTAVGQIAAAYKAVTVAENAASQELENLANTAISLGENLAAAIASGGADGQRILRLSRD